jgi:anti-sigma B factor antagonist
VSVADQPHGESDLPRIDRVAGDLRVATTTAGAATVLTVEGEVDMRTVPALRERVDSHFADPSASRRPLVFDLRGVGFFGSAGLAVLTSAHQRATAVDAAVWVVATARTVTRPLQITGLDALLHVTDDLAAALNAIG